MRFLPGLAAEFWGSYNRICDWTAAARLLFPTDLGPQELSDFNCEASGGVVNIPVFWQN